MAEYPALDLLFADPRDAVLADLLYAELDAFEPIALQDEPAGRWRVFFRDATARDAARRALAAAFGARLASLCAVDVDDEDWARRSQAALTSVRAGRIVISPPWDVSSGGALLRPDEHRADIRIVIDPSMGFGTGHHPTTRLCLELLQQTEVPGLDVLDVGTGSGVLAIAASQLGARSVTAIDSDEDAIENARANIVRNGVATSVVTACLNLADCATDADVVLANLTGATVQRHAHRLLALVRPGGRLIVSGFSPGERDDVVKALGGGVTHDAREGEWAAAIVVPAGR